MTHQQALATSAYTATKRTVKFSDTKKASLRTQAGYGQKTRRTGDRMALRQAVNEVIGLFRHLDRRAGLVTSSIFGSGTDAVRARRDFFDVPSTLQR